MTVKVPQVGMFDRKHVTTAERLGVGLAVPAAELGAEFVGPGDVPLVVAIVFDAETKASKQEDQPNQADPQGDSVRSL